MEDQTADLTRMEGFPDPVGDRVEDGIAYIIMGLHQISLGTRYIHTGRDLLGSAALQSRRNARMRHNKRVQQLAQARKAKRPADTERLAG